MNLVMILIIVIDLNHFFVIFRLIVTYFLLGDFDEKAYVFPYII